MNIFRFQGGFWVSKCWTLELQSLKKAICLLSPKTAMEAAALSSGLLLCSTYTPESATVTEFRASAPVSTLTDALPLWAGKTACWSPTQVRVRDSPTAQLPLRRLVKGDRDSVTESPTTAGLMEGLTSTAPEARTPEEEKMCHWLLNQRQKSPLRFSYVCLPCIKASHTIARRPSLFFFILHGWSEEGYCFSSIILVFASSPPPINT